MEDRRKHQRFKLRDSCIINHSEVVGSIVDISMGGIACTCFDQNQCHQGFLQKMDIYCKKEGLWAKELGVRILASEAVPGMFAEEFSVRKCRLQFVQLTETQEEQLEKLIMHAVLP